MIYGKVKVTADQHGNIIGVYKNNPEYGYVRVEQEMTVINQQGWLRKTKRSGFIKGEVEMLQQVKFYEGQELPGKIVVKESHEPFNQENPDQNLKIAGDTGVICRVDDTPIYRESYYTTDTNAQDELISHNNTDEIRQVAAATRLMNNFAKRERAEVVTL